MRTGRFRFRETWFGRQVLEVEIKEPGDNPGDWYIVWRKASGTDAQTIHNLLGGQLWGFDSFKYRTVGGAWREIKVPR